jgi:hypothetical protein
LPRKTRVYDRGKSVRRLARERIGPAPPSRAIQPRIDRKKPKHKKFAEEGEAYTS